VTRVVFSLVFSTTSCLAQDPLVRPESFASVPSPALTSLTEMLFLLFLASATAGWLLGGLAARDLRIAAALVPAVLVAPPIVFELFPDRPESDVSNAIQALAPGSVTAFIAYTAAVAWYWRDEVEGGHLAALVFVWLVIVAGYFAYVAVLTG